MRPRWQSIRRRHSAVHPWAEAPAKDGRSRLSCLARKPVRAGKKAGEAVARTSRADARPAMKERPVWHAQAREEARTGSEKRDSFAVMNNIGSNIRVVPARPAPAAAGARQLPAYRHDRFESLAAIAAGAANHGHDHAAQWSRIQQFLPDIMAVDLLAARIKRARITSQRADANLEETAVGACPAHLFAQEFGAGHNPSRLVRCRSWPWNRQYQLPGPPVERGTQNPRGRALRARPRGEFPASQWAEGSRLPPANLHAAWANGSSPASAVAIAMMSRAATTLAWAATVPTPPRSV